MTAPIGQEAVSNQWAVMFTMPARFTLATLPSPTDDRVRLRAIPARRMAAVRAHASQLEAGRGPATYLTAPGFLEEVEARARTLGALIGARYGEGFRVRGPVAIADARALLDGPAGEGA